MPNLKEVRNRINSVKSTQQITKAMKMVAAAKLRRAQDSIIQLRPYASKLQEVLQNVSSNTENVSTPFSVKRDVKKSLIVVISSDRGLCGAFNSNVFKAVNKLFNEKYSANKENVELLCIGKKSAEFFQRRKFNVINDYVSLLTDLNFINAKKVSEFVLSSFSSGKYDEVYIVYNEFKNVATQFVRAEQYLPIVQNESDLRDAKTEDYIFEPSQEYIVTELIPTSLKIQLYKAVLESNASEHGARMTAMDKATENAGELLMDLKLVYNRSRQAAITKEILEIVGGAEALNN